MSVVKVFELQNVGLPAAQTFHGVVVILELAMISNWKVGDFAGHPCSRDAYVHDTLGCLGNRVPGTAA